MKTVYIVSGNGGSYVNFFCSLIGTDANYGSMPFMGFNEKNQFAARQLDLQQYIKDNSTGIIFPDVTSEIQKQIADYTVDKNLLLHTHYYGDKSLPFPNVKKIRFFADDEHVLLMYLMFLAKVCTQYDTLTETFISKKLKSEINPDRADNLITDQLVSRLSISAYMMDMSDEEYVINFYPTYRNGVSDQSFESWTHMNPNELFFTPEKVADKWQEYFDTKSPINPDLLKKYHENNLKLVESTFGVKYEDMLSNGWESAVLTFVKKYKTPISLKSQI